MRLGSNIVSLMPMFAVHILDFYIPATHERFRSDFGSFSMDVMMADI